MGPKNAGDPDRGVAFLVKVGVAPPLFFVFFAAEMNDLREELIEEKLFDLVFDPIFPDIVFAESFGYLRAGETFVALRDDRFFMLLGRERAEALGALVFARELTDVFAAMATCTSSPPEWHPSSLLRLQAHPFLS